MTSRAICVTVLLSTLPAAGCGTVANLARPNPDQGGRMPFGGVRQDVACLKQASGETDHKAHPRTESEQYSRTMLKLFCAADLPFSLIGDIVTWPYAAAYATINQPIPTPPVLLADSVVTQPPPTRPMPIPIPPLPQPAVENRPKPPAPDPLPNPPTMP